MRVSGSPPVLLNVARPWGETSPVSVAQVAAAAGLDGVGLADSPTLFPDPLIATERVLSETSVSLAGPCVLSLGLREPSTAVGALRTLAQRHEDRVACFVGRGESSMRNAGLPIPSLQDHLDALERLVENASRADVRASLVGAASGPRTIARTSAVLPGVLVDVGVDPSTVRRAVEIARAANPSVHIWLFLRAAVAETDDAVASAAAPVLGSCAARLATAPDFYGLSEGERAQADRVAAAHDYQRHGTTEAASSVVPRADQALVRDRFLAVGPALGVRAVVAELATLDLAGVVLAGAVGRVLEGLPELSAAVSGGLRSREGGGAS